MLLPDSVCQLRLASVSRFASAIAAVARRAAFRIRRKQYPYASNEHRLKLGPVAGTKKSRRTLQRITGRGSAIGVGG